MDMNQSYDTNLLTYLIHERDEEWHEEDTAIDF